MAALRTLSLSTKLITYSNLNLIYYLLHGNDPEMVLLAAPDQKVFILVVKDAPARRPIPNKGHNISLCSLALLSTSVPDGVGGPEEPVALLEEEVIVDQLLLGLLAHVGQRVVVAGEVALEALQGLRDHGLEVLVVLLLHVGVEREAVHGPATSEFDNKG